MNNVVSFPIPKSYADRIKNIRFKLRNFILVDEDRGLKREYPFIVLSNELNKKFKVCALSNFFYKNKAKNKMYNRSHKTKEDYGKIIVLFLNYVFFDKYGEFQLKNIEDITIEHGERFLEDYANGLVGYEYKSRDTVQLAEQKLYTFYKYLYKELKGMKYLSKEDFGDEKLTNRNFKTTNVGKIPLFTVSYPQYVPPTRIQRMSTKLFAEILDVCNKHYPHMKLMFCLQAFAGLRAGEVCNVSTDKVQFGLMGKEFSSFTIDLREETRMRTDYKSTGRIKRKRIQAVHPIFLRYLKHVYDQHKKLISERNNPLGAIFLNRKNEAMMESSYNNNFNKIIELLIKRLVDRGDFASIGQVNELRSSKLNKHIFRYFFTQHVAQHVKTPNELASWRGDLSLESSIRYLAQSKDIDEKLILIQEAIFKEFI